MKLRCSPETDRLYIELEAGVGAKTREIIAGLNVDMDERGEIAGFDIGRAARTLDLTTLETIAPPVGVMRVA